MRSPLYYILLVLIILLLLLFIQIQIFSLVLDKLGLTPNSAVLLLITTLFGSAINLPLARVKATPPPSPPPEFAQRWPFKLPPFTGYTLIAINVGGALVPIMFSVYLYLNQSLPLEKVLLGIAIVGAVSFLFSRPIAGLGIAMPIFVAPITAAVTAILLAPDNSPPLAYICGTLGVLVGADLLRLKEIPKLGTPVASIGGAGTFDGIFFTGIIAVLLS